MTLEEGPEFFIAEQVAYYLDPLDADKRAQVMAFLIQRYKIAVPKSNMQYRRTKGFKPGPKNGYRSKGK